MEKTVNLFGHELTISEKQKSPLSKEEISSMLSALADYKRAKESFDRKLIENENWFKGNAWQYISRSGKNDTDFRPAGTYLLNGIWHKHAEAMENYPQPVFLEREKGDRKTAETLSKIVPLVLEKNGFKNVYSDIWWYKLKQGSGVYGVFWDKNLENGLGDISVKKIDLLRFYCEPHVSSIQDSRYVFLLSLCSTAEAKRRYPNADIKRNGHNMTLKGYFGTEDLSGKVMIVDCYEKVKLPNGKTAVHLTKLIGESAVYSSKTDPLFENTGIYAHGMYPFVVDTMVPIEGSPFGMGLVDIGKNAQAQVNKLEYLIERNALIASRQRFLVKRDGGIDPEKLSDLSVDFIECDRNVDDSFVRPIQANPLPQSIIDCRDEKIEELKELIGNRDFSQGETAKGVTAYAAISALQKAGNRLSRDCIDSSYRSFSEVVYMIVELISQFYTDKRSFRIVGENSEVSYLAFGGDRSQPFTASIFDIEITAQKKNAVDSLSHNELILDLFKAGAFDEEKRDAARAAINAMMLDTKQSILQSLK